MAKKTLKRPVRKKSYKKPSLFVPVVLLVILVLLCAGGLIWRHHRDVNAKNAAATIVPKPTTSKGTGTSTSTSTSSSSSGTASKTPTTSSSSSSTSSSPTTTSPTTASGEAPAKPVGTFVDNHYPGQNDSPADQDGSDCVTTPGATCYISFTQGSVTKKLATETTDSSGAAYWNTWQPSVVGLTSGNWTVSATATLNNQTATTTDSTALVIQ